MSWWWLSIVYEHKVWFRKPIIIPQFINLCIAWYIDKMFLNSQLKGKKDSILHLMLSNFLLLGLGKAVHQCKLALWVQFWTISHLQVFLYVQTILKSLPKAIKSTPNENWQHSVFEISVWGMVQPNNSCIAKTIHCASVTGMPPVLSFKNF